LFNSRHYPDIHLDELKQTKKILIHCSRCFTEILTGHILHTNKKRVTGCSVADDRHSISVALSKQASGHITTLKKNNAQRCQLYPMQAKVDLP